MRFFDEGSHKAEKTPAGRPASFLSFSHFAALHCPCHGHAQGAHSGTHTHKYLRRPPGPGEISTKLGRSHPFYANTLFGRPPLSECSSARLARLLTILLRPQSSALLRSRSAPLSPSPFAGPAVARQSFAGTAADVSPIGHTTASRVINPPFFCLCSPALLLAVILVLPSLALPSSSRSFKARVSARPGRSGCYTLKATLPGPAPLEPSL